jgi:hypothetical protein
MDLLSKIAIAVFPPLAMPSSEYFPISMRAFVLCIVFAYGYEFGKHIPRTRTIRTLIICMLLSMLKAVVIMFAALGCIIPLMYKTAWWYNIDMPYTNIAIHIMRLTPVTFFIGSCLGAILGSFFEFIRSIWEQKWTRPMYNQDSPSNVTPSNVTTGAGITLKPLSEMTHAEKRERLKNKSKKDM